MTASILAGAEPWSGGSGPVGALVLHGFTGTPQSVRGVAERLAKEGFTVDLPLLPGHGTSPDDLKATGWDDWSSAAQDAFTRLEQRCEQVVVFGLSMGGALALWLGTQHPQIKALVLVNPAAVPMDEAMSGQLAGLLQAGTEFIPGVGSDIADPEAKELAYEVVPLAAVLSLNTALTELIPALPTITSPVLLLTSVNDHVVPAASGDAVAEKASGPVERIVLERSFHVATLDVDRQLIEDQTVRFCLSATGQSA